MKRALFTLTLFILLLVPCSAQEQSKIEEDKPHFRDPSVLIVKINSNGTLTLNNEEQAGITELGKRLSDLFSYRLQIGFYRKGMGNRYDIPEMERIEKAVWVLAASNLSGDSVAEVINALKLAGASPIKMLTEEDYQRYLDEMRSYDERRPYTAPENPSMQRKGKVRSKKTKPQ